MENLPGYISIIFVLTTFITFLFFYKASNNSKWVLMISTGWLLLQAILAASGFYFVTTTAVPRFILAILPGLILIVFLFSSRNGRHFIDNIDLKIMTALHVIRIPVELVLFWLFINRTVPGIMTFEGRNLDILSGLTAPVIWYFGYVKNRFSNPILLVWNVCCMLLLFNIVMIAVLSAPFNFQQLAFDQPNIAILHFPFI